MNERVYAIKRLLTLCANKYNDDNILNMPFECSDRGSNEERIYSMCYDSRNPSRKQLCGVDWVFYHWPSASIASFRALVNEVVEAGNCEPEIDKVGWYGNINSPLRDTIEFSTRPFLKIIGEDNPDLFDIFHVEPVNRIIDHKVKHYMSIPEMVKKYRYLVDIGGNGYSGRLKVLLYSRRPVLLVERRYVEYFHDLLVPFVHYIPVKKDLSDLIEKVLWLRNNKDAGEQIAINAYIFAMTHFTEEKMLERIYNVYTYLTKNK